MSCDPSQAELRKDFAILDDMGQFLLESVIPKLVSVVIFWIM